MESKFSLTAGKRESIKIILPIFQYVSKARWATYLHLMSNYDGDYVPETFKPVDR
jgi:hypothetical protein